MGGVGGEESLEALLARLGLEKLLPTLLSNDVASLASLRLLTEADFKEMGVSIGYRRRLLDALGQPAAMPAAVPAPAAAPDGGLLAGLTLASPIGVLGAAPTAAALPPSLPMQPMGGGVPAPAGAPGGGADMFGSLNLVGSAAPALPAAVPVAPPDGGAASGGSAFGFLGGPAQTGLATARPGGMLDASAFTDHGAMTSVGSAADAMVAELPGDPVREEPAEKLTPEAMAQGSSAFSFM